MNTTQSIATRAHATSTTGLKHLNFAKRGPLVHNSCTPQPSRRGQPLQNTVAGIGLLFVSAAQSRSSAESCGFSFCAPSFGGSNVGPQGRLLTASAGTQVDQPVRAASPIGLGVAVVQTVPLEAFMAQSPASGASASSSLSSTSCKPGDIAIFIAGRNLGKLVHIDRTFIGEEVIGGTLFCKTPNAYQAWVVTSLGGPLVSRFIDGPVNPKPNQTAPFDENMLRPLRNPRGADQTMRWSGKPTRNTQGAAA